MNYLRCWFLQAARGIRSGWLIQLAATGAIAVGLLLVSLAFLGTSNVERLTQFWGRGFQAVAYLKHDTSASQAAALARLLEKRPEVLAVRQVSSTEALRRLQESLGQRKELLEGVEAQFLPASLEISLSDQHPEQTRSLLSMLAASKLVEEVDHMGDWSRRLNSLVHLLRWSGLGIALVVALACLYIIGSTIRLGVHARREEIDILKLVGATEAFIKAPFVIEGAIQGLCGALFATGLVYAVFKVVAPRIEALLTAAISHVSLSFLPAGQVALVLAGGAALGILGSAMALRRYTDL